MNSFPRPWLVITGNLMSCHMSTQHNDLSVMMWSQLFVISLPTFV